MRCTAFYRCGRAHSRQKRAKFHVVQRRLDLVEDAEGRRIDALARQIERDGGEGLLAARQQRNALDRFPRRAEDDVDAALERILRVLSSRCALPPPNSSTKTSPNTRLMFFEAVGERRFPSRVQAADGVVKAAAGLFRSSVCAVRKSNRSLVSLFLDGVGVNAAHRADLRLEAGQPGGALSILSTAGGARRRRNRSFRTRPRACS